MNNQLGVKDKYYIQKISYEEIKEWLLHKHYAKRIPSVKYSFGIIEKSNKKLQGVCCFGSPANYHNNNLGSFDQIELVRLVINEGLEKNLLSFFVSGCFSFLEKPLSIISYADQGKNHHGYIYQATNWIYTGLGGGVDFFIDKDGNERHSRILYDYRDRFPGKSREEIAELIGWKKCEGTYKHRYFYFLGSKKEKKQWMKELQEKYEILPYPKGENIRYDSCYNVITKKRLF